MSEYTVELDGQEYFRIPRYDYRSKADALYQS